MGDAKMIDQRLLIRRRARAWLLLVLAAVVVLFAAARVSHVRLDWTEDGIYTLSESTRAILQQLDEPVMVHAYITEGLPQPYGRLQRFIEDMLMAYHEAGGGKFGYEMIDPASDANVAASLNAMQVPKVRVQVVENDQAQVKQGYLAIVIEYLDRKETIPVVQGEEGFEYLLTRKIKKLTGKGRGKVGVATGFGAPPLYQLHRLQQFAGDDYEFVSVEPGTRDIPGDVDVLIVGGLRQKPSQAFRYRVDQFRMAGHGLMVLAGNALPDLARGFRVQPVDVYANDWLASDLGVMVEPGLVVDRRATRVLVNQQQGMFMMRSAIDYPFVISATDLNGGHPVSRGMESLTLPFASPLNWTDRVKQGQVLARSSELSTVQSGPPFDVDPLQSIASRFEGVALQRSNLILAVDGEMKSAFSSAPQGWSEKHRHLARVNHGRLLVAGAPAMLDDEFLDGANTVFALNVLDWLAGDEGLIALRSRGVTDRPLANITQQARDAWKWLWMFGLPALVILTGLGRWWLLRRRLSGV